jgi:hypothetical protein
MSKSIWLMCYLHSYYCQFNSIWCNTDNDYESSLISEISWHSTLIPWHHSLNTRGKQHLSIPPNHLRGCIMLPYRTQVLRVQHDPWYGNFGSHHISTDGVMIYIILWQWCTFRDVLDTNQCSGTSSQTDKQSEMRQAIKHAHTHIPLWNCWRPDY